MMRSPTRMPELRSRSGEKGNPKQRQQDESSSNNKEERTEEATNNDEEEIKTTITDYQECVHLLDTLFIEGQKVSKPKLIQIKDRLMQWAVNQIKIINKKEALEEENQMLKKQVQETPAKTTYAQITEKNINTTEKK